MSSIQERIAALNMGHVGRVPSSTTPQPLAKSRPAPPPLPRSNSTDEQATHAFAHDGNTIGNQPSANPSRPAPPQRPEPKLWTHCAPSSRQTQQKPPPLPSRNSQGSIVRRDSQDSVTSTISTRSSLSLPSTRTSTSVDSRSTEQTGRVKAPVYDASKLPPLPPSRREQAAAVKPALPARHSSSSSITSLSNTAIEQTTPPPRLTSTTQPSVTARPGLPPRPPPRTRAQQSIPEEPHAVAHHRAHSEVQPRPTPAVRSALSFGLNKNTEATPSVPARPDTAAPGDPSASPPPIPHASRPDLAALQASKPKLTSTPSYTRPSYQTPPTTTYCMLCRDFSGPDNHAARFPRAGLPTQDLAWLGRNLTSIFPSPTDKARAIFTWLHHNIAYNTEAFFSDNVKSSTPSSTLSTGLAVCEGYAALFVALATHAGLEAVVVGGHGKGFGYTEGSPVPSGGPTGHAWAAVKIDDGAWKLCDPCWGAGHVDGQTKSYTKAFNAAQFTMTNEEFGRRHFPENPRHFYVARPPTFAQYWTWGAPEPPADGPGEDVQVFTGCEDVHGIGERTLLPRKRHINMRALGMKSRVQFRFSAICEHWDHAAKGTGPSYVFVLSIGGVDGRKKDLLPFMHDAEHRHWWLDVPVEELGCPGQNVNINNVTTVGGEDARGWSVKRVMDAKGRKGMSWSGVASWQLI